MQEPNRRCDTTLRVSVRSRNERRNTVRETGRNGICCQKILYARVYRIDRANKKKKKQEKKYRIIKAGRARVYPQTLLLVFPRRGERKTRYTPAH